MAPPNLLIPATITYTVLVTMTIPIRIWARHEKRLHLWIDDYLAIIAAVSPLLEEGKLISDLENEKLLFVIIYTVPVILCE